MNLSVRVKLVILLAIVALLPLLAAILTIAIGGRRLQSELISRSVQSVTAKEALALHVSLRKDIEKLLLSLSEPMIVSELMKLDAPLRQDQLDELDAVWRTLPNRDPRMAAVLNHPIASELKRFRSEDPRLVEIFVTDRYGQLVAATGKTGDFYQADEDWWQGVENRGQSRMFIPPINYDVSSGVFSLDLCIPIVQDGRFYGVGKAVLNIRSWIGPEEVSIGETDANVILVRNSDGMIVFRRDTVPLTQTAEEWFGPIVTSDAPGWRVTKNGYLQGYAPIRLPKHIGLYDVATPDWRLVLSVPRAQALRGVTRLSIIVLAVGLTIIVVIFLVGLFLVDHVVVRRIQYLQQATQRIAGGDLTHRIEPHAMRRLLGARDEIDHLSEDFNEMVSHIQQTQQQLQTANELKTNFIRIASHELRTPISYILGTVRLMKDCFDADRLRHALQSMGGKAKRLEAIIQAMFKLMPEQRSRSDMHYSQLRVSELLEEVYLDTFPFVERRNQRLIIEGAEKFKFVTADREKLRDVLENLVMNAIKFTPDNGAVKLRVSQQLGGYVSFAVQDQGPGIPESDLPHIFEPFFTGRDVMRHSTGRSGYAKSGMGLGLAVVRHFTELHGGTVNVTSGSHGSIFTVTIPLQPTHTLHEPTSPAESETAPDDAQEGKKETHLGG